ncbi:MAG: hypothetical protein LUH56_00870 [Oscillospiraceae bacterium]|nr:hypothetical protein [Oscillospiraceae bacterium]
MSDQIETTEITPTEPAEYVSSCDTIEYGFDEESWLEGYDMYYKLYRRKRTICFVVLFLVLAALFVQQVVLDPTYGVGWTCLAICLAIALVYALAPAYEKRNVKRALPAIENDRHVLKIYPEKITVRTILPEDDAQYLEPDESGNLMPYPEIPETVIDLTDKTLKTAETDKMFAVYTKYTQSIIPKADLSEEELERLKQCVIRRA